MQAQKSERIPVEKGGKKSSSASIKIRFVMARDDYAYLQTDTDRYFSTVSLAQLESGWMVAVTYYNGFRIIIPMNEMMINLSGDGRENADTLNRQVRIANNMLGCDIDFIIKDLDTKSRSVVASRKDAMLKNGKSSTLEKRAKSPF